MVVSVTVTCKVLLALRQVVPVASVLPPWLSLLLLTPLLSVGWPGSTAMVSLNG